MCVQPHFSTNGTLGHYHDGPEDVFSRFFGGLAIVLCIFVEGHFLRHHRQPLSLQRGRYPPHLKLGAVPNVVSEITANFKLFDAINDILNDQLPDNDA